MSLTYQEALSRIGTEGYTGAEGLRRLVNETSAVATNAAPDAALLLYSKSVGEFNAWEVAQQVSDSSVGSGGTKRVVTIADTDVYKLLNDRLFTTALRDAVGGDPQTY